MLRVINILLLLVALLGAFLSFRSGWEYRRLQAEHRSLLGEVGLLRVGDPNKVHLVAIDTGEPLHYAWQMYVPAKFEEQWHVQLGAGGTSTHHSSASTEPHFDVVRVRIRKQPNGDTAIWVKHRGGSSYTGLPSQDADLLEGSQLPIEYLGATGTAVLDPEEVATLVRISAPDASGKAPLLEVRFGSKQAFQNQQAP